MLNRNNAHFEELRRIGEDYEERRKELAERKQEIIDTYGWDSDELKAWYEEKGKMTYPIEAGACKAYRAWLHTIERGENEVDMNDFLWDREVEDFVDTFRKAGIKSFIYTNQSTAVMENIHGFEAACCKMEGLCKIERIERRFGEDKTEEIMGIRFSL